MTTEQDARRRQIDPQLQALGWERDGNEVYAESPKTDIERRAQTKADYYLYLDGIRDAVAVVEAKKENVSLDGALKQSLGYVQRLRGAGAQPIAAFATDGVATRAAHYTGEPLQINGEQVMELLPPQRIRQFYEKGTPHLIRGEVPKSSMDMVRLFKQAGRVLRKEGIIQLDALVEFSQILFIKLLTELSDDDATRESPPVRWDEIANLAGERLMNEYPAKIRLFTDAYPGTFRATSIKKPETLEKLIQLIAQLSLADAPTEVKGQAYEYFLREYNKGKSDLGQHFTARHVIKAMVGLVDPEYGEQIYDPFCGTAGMLIEGMQAILARNGGKLDRILSSETCFGTEITEAAQTAKMNIILAGDGNSGIERANSMTPEIQAKHRGRRDIVLTNIPFTSGEELNYIQHCLNSITTDPRRNGRFAIIVPERVLDRADSAYTEIRRRLVQEWNIRRVVSLPREVFSGLTSAKTSIIYGQRRRDSASAGIPYVDIQDDGFTKDSRRLPLPGVSDLDRMVENRLNDDGYCLLQPSESDRFRLKPASGEITVSSRYDVVSLRDVAREKTQIVTVVDEMDVREPGFSTDGKLRTLVVKETKKGYNTKGKRRKLISPGDLVISRLHTQDGLFAIAEDECHATETFLIMDVDQTIANPVYVLLSLHHVAPKMAQVDTTGREQYATDALLSLPIALPPLPVQQEIAGEWIAAVNAYKQASANLNGVHARFAGHIAGEAES